MKGLEALHSLYDTMPLAFEETYSVKYFEIIEKELKALEIIRNALGIHLVETIGNKHYIEITGKDMVGICKDNYELLKEVLL